MRSVAALALLGLITMPALAGRRDRGPAPTVQTETTVPGCCCCETTIPIQQTVMVPQTVYEDVEVECVRMVPETYTKTVKVAKTEMVPEVRTVMARVLLEQPATRVQVDAPGVHVDVDPCVACGPSSVAVDVGPTPVDDAPRGLLQRLRARRGSRGAMAH